MSRRLKMTTEEKEALAIFFVEGLRNRFFDRKKPLISKSQLCALSDLHLRNRNAFYFLTRNIKFKHLRVPGPRSNWKIPIDLLTKEIIKAKQNKGAYEYAWRFWHPAKIIPSHDLGVDYFFRELTKYVNKDQSLSGACHYFYGIEGKCKNGPQPISRGYFKYGMTSVGKSGAQSRYSTRHRHDNWYPGSASKYVPTESWSIRLKRGVSGRKVEKLFERSFGSHCCEWADTKTRYLKEYFKQDATIKKVAARLAKSYPP